MISWMHHLIFVLSNVGLIFDQDLFFFTFIIKNTTTTTIASTIKIPKPIPALKIPDTASQEVIINERNSSITTAKGFIFFMI